MKKIIFFALCLILTSTVFASSQDKYQYEYENVTIVFEENTSFSSEERQIISDYLAYRNYDNDISTYSLCWLTGHKLTTDSVIEIQHKVSPKTPRCYRTIYEVSKCSKCDYVETTKRGSSFIACCAED